MNYYQIREEWSFSLPCLVFAANFHKSLYTDCFNYTYMYKYNCKYQTKIRTISLSHTEANRQQAFQTKKKEKDLLMCAVGAVSMKYF